MIPTKQLRECLRGLRKHFPTDAPVRVRQIDGLDVSGQTSRGKRGYRIDLAGHKNTELLFHVLLHEWAHARTWRAMDAAGHSHHDILWAVEYIKIWRWYEEEWT